MQSVSEIMSTVVRTIHRDTIICDLEAIFIRYKISGAPLVDDSGKLAGFVSKSDVSRFDSTGEDPNYARVYEIACPVVIATTPSTSIESAAQKMLEAHVHHLVVMEDEHLVGVLSSFDYVKFVAQGSGLVEK
ncbi:MAG: CBS domain-containing protein [Gammaproteobacteria bacterium]|nr:CBS domain-containing protein [Gammaproteobacteria bacterium]